MYSIKTILINMPFWHLFRQVVNGEASVYNINTTSIGNFLSTKQVGENRREDLTNYYKPEEGKAKFNLVLDNSLKIKFIFSNS